MGCMFLPAGHGIGTDMARLGQLLLYKTLKKNIKKKEIYYPSCFDTSQRKYCEADLLTSSQLLMLDFQLSRQRVKQGD